MVPGDPDFLAQQRFLHEVVRGRLWADGGLPHVAETRPHAHRFGALESDHTARTGERRIQIPFEEAREQARWTVGETNLALACGAGDVGAPGLELVIRERVDVGARGQILERLLVDRQHVRRLRPGHVVVLVGVELAQLEDLGREITIRQPLHERADVVHVPGRDERRDIAVLSADDTDRDLAGLLLRRQSILTDEAPRAESWSGPAASFRIMLLILVVSSTVLNSVEMNWTAFPPAVLAVPPAAGAPPASAGVARGQEQAHGQGSPKKRDFMRVSLPFPALPHEARTTSCRLQIRGFLTPPDAPKW